MLGHPNSGIPLGRVRSSVLVTVAAWRWQVYPGFVEREDRWVRVGHATRAAGFEAGFVAAGHALGDDDDAALLIVFASEALDLPELLQGIAERSQGAPLIGCSTAGEIAPEGPDDASVVVTALGGPGFEAATTVARGASQNLRDAGAEVAGALRRLKSEHEHRVLILLTDGLSGDQQEIVRGAYGVAGAAVPMVGGCAGDDLRMRSTHQFFGTEVLEDAVVGAALASDAPIGIGVRHGWRRIGEPMLITESDHNRVLTIDGQPALDLYLKRLDAPAEAREDHDAFVRFAATHPLGLARRRGEEHVRFVAGADFAQRTLSCIAEVPRGALAWFMEGDDGSVLAATDEACADALAPLGGRPPLGMVAFDCIARRSVLGDAGIRREIDHVAQHSSGAPIAGFYTYGEIARTQGISGFHNQTLVVLAVS